MRERAQEQELCPLSLAHSHALSRTVLSTPQARGPRVSAGLVLYLAMVC